LFESPTHNLPKLNKEIKVALRDGDTDDNFNNSMNSANQKFNKIVKSDVMPDLKKYSLRDAISVLSRMGLKFKVTGAGRIVSQSIAPGEKIRKGILCTLDCRETLLNGAAVY
jgi:cell division protein FtsI (penicillin-binding protein 3)